MYNLLTILGATATGKTSLAVRLAAELKGEIISADSRQIYRGMDLGTGKDLNEYVHEGTSVPYHLIDIADAGFRFNLFIFIGILGNVLAAIIIYLLLGETYLRVVRGKWFVRGIHFESLPDDSCSGKSRITGTIGL